MKLITILGPTAVGKTKLAVELAARIDGEIISADSRQVYRGMDIGTGKDLEDFKINESLIQHHLIDIKEAGEEYNLFEFQQDFYKAYQSIIAKGKTPILCGGTGMYLQAALAEEQLLEVPVDNEKRSQWNLLTDEELRTILITLNPDQHNSTDLTNRERTIRAIEIEEFKKVNEPKPSPIKERIVFGIKMEREALRTRIKERLDSRLADGMIEEVEYLLKNGISHEQMDFYGLEYRFISNYLKGSLTYDEMYVSLLQAIRRFAKKQMTWFRRMEKLGTSIYWLDARNSQQRNLSEILDQLDN